MGVWRIMAPINIAATDVPKRGILSPINRANQVDPPNMIVVINLFSLLLLRH